MEDEKKKDLNESELNASAQAEKGESKESKKGKKPPVKLIAVVAVVAVVAVAAIALLAGGGVAHTHEFGEWTTTKSATCTEDGIRERFCSCGETQSQVIAKIGHEYGEWTTTKSATCFASGEEERACVHCGDVQCNELPSVGHIYSHGRCEGCNDVSNAYEALAYYVYKNGKRDSEGEYSISYSYDTSYFYVYTDSLGKTLSLRMLSYASDYSSSTFISMELKQGQTLQDVGMLWEDYYCSGEIYINTFNDTTETVYSFYTDCPYSSMKSSLKSLMGSSISLMFSGTNLLLISETDLDITMADLGVTNYN